MQWLRSFIVGLLFITHNAHPEGFCKGTQVTTPSGLQDIEKLEPGHTIVSFDDIKKICAHSTVLQLHKHKVHTCLEMRLGSTVLEVDEKQRFLDADCQTWCTARDLKIGQRILTGDQIAQVITYLKRKQLAKERTLYALSLCDGPRTLCVTKDKIVAHNFEPIIALTTIYTIFSWARTAVQVYGAVKAGKSSASNPFEERFDQMVDEAREMTLGDLVNGNTGKIPPDVLNDFIKKHGPMTKLADIPEPELNSFAKRIGVDRALLGCEKTAQQTTAVQPKIDSAPKTASALQKAAVSGAARGAMQGALEGVVQVGVGLATGDVASIGTAAAKIGTSVATKTAKSAGIQAGKAALTAAGNKLVPEITKKILKALPFVGPVYMACDMGQTAVAGIRRLCNRESKNKKNTNDTKDNSYAIHVNNNTYICKEKLDMSSVSEITHLNLGPDKPGPACSHHNPNRKITYYNKAGKLLTDQELAIVKKQDIARRQAEGDWHLLPPERHKACAARTNIQETKKPSCGAAQPILPTIPTCPSATATKEPIPVCGLQEAKIPVPPQQSCSAAIVKEKAAILPCNASQASKQLSLRDATVSATMQSNSENVVEEAKIAAPAPSQEAEKKEAHGTIKTVENLIADSEPWTEKDFCKQFVKKGGYEQAVRDFESLSPTEVRDITRNDNTVRTGVLSDGRKINVRQESSAKCATLEIQKSNKTSEKAIKFRYGVPKY